MPYAPQRRRSIRLQGYDYTTQGAYYVTICAQTRGELFGTVSGGEVILNLAGAMIADYWLALATKFAGIGLGAWSSCSTICTVC